MEKKEIPLFENGIPYYTEGLETPNSMTLCLADTDKPLPCLLVIPGGSYHYREKGEAFPITDWFNAHGFNAAILNYRVEPNRYPAALADAQRAVRLLRAGAENWNIDPDKIIVAGFSAGGHLAASTVTLDEVPIPEEMRDAADEFSPFPNGAILSYPVISVEAEFGHVNSGRNLLGELYEEKKSEFSLQNCVHGNMPPVFLWHTVEDSCVNVKNSLVFAEALRDANVEFEMHIYPHGRHGLALAESYEDVRGWKELAVSWIHRNIK